MGWDGLTSFQLSRNAVNACQFHNTTEDRTQPWTFHLVFYRAPSCHLAYTWHEITRLHAHQPSQAKPRRAWQPPPARGCGVWVPSKFTSIWCSSRCRFYSYSNKSAKSAAVLLVLDLFRRWRKGRKRKVFCLLRCTSAQRCIRMPQASGAARRVVCLYTKELRLNSGKTGATQSHSSAENPQPNVVSTWKGRIVFVHVSAEKQMETTIIHIIE